MKLRVQVGLTLKVEQEIAQGFVLLINQFFEIIKIEIAGRSRKGSQATGAFRAAQIAGSCWFEG
jgi:hypothetical protein